MTHGSRHKKTIRGHYQNTDADNSSESPTPAQSSTSVCWNWFSLRTAELYISCFLPSHFPGSEQKKVVRLYRFKDQKKSWYPGDLRRAVLLCTDWCQNLSTHRYSPAPGPQLDSASPARQNAHMMIILEMKNAAACSPVHKKSSQKFPLIKSSPLCHDIAAPVMSSSSLSSLLPSIL